MPDGHLHFHQYICQLKTSWLAPGGIDAKQSIPYLRNCNLYIVIEFLQKTYGIDPSELK